MKLLKALKRTNKKKIIKIKFPEYQERAKVKSKKGRVENV